MAHKTAIIGVARGTGLVARYGDVVVYLPQDGESTDRILGAAEAAATAADPGATIVTRLLAAVFGGSSGAATFGLLAPTKGGLLVLLRGPVAATVASASGPRRLSGTRAMTWLDEIIRDPVRHIMLGDDATETIAAAAHSDLRGGVVPGGGLVLRNPVRTDDAERESAKNAGAEPDRTARAELPGARPKAERTPAAGHAIARAQTPNANPVSGQDRASKSASAPPGSGSQDASSLNPNHSAGQDRTSASSPAAGNPSGARPVAQPPVPAPAAARDIGEATTVGVPHGTLTGADGSTYPLDRPYVLGREPLSDEAVRRAQASPIVLAHRQISRVHARIAVEHGIVTVQDAGTPGGTFIAAPGAEEWTRLGDAPAELPPDWSLRIADRILTHLRD